MLLTDILSAEAIENAIKDCEGMIMLKLIFVFRTKCSTITGIKTH